MKNNIRLLIVFSILLTLSVSILYYVGLNKATNLDNNIIRLNDSTVLVNKLNFVPGIIPMYYWKTDTIIKY